MKKVAGDQMEADVDPGEGQGGALTGRAPGGPRSDAADEAGREEVLLTDLRLGGAWPPIS